jgi:DNA-binding transcriptional regulator YiaG
MANLAAALKDTIRRLARKEIKAETGKTKDAVVRYRREIAALKRQVQAQERAIARLKVQERERPGQAQSTEESAEKMRFSVRSVKAQRRRLGLSAEDYGKLVGVSPLTVYSWEHGRSRPRNAQFTRLVAVRGIGKRKARQKLEMLKTEKPRRGAKGSRSARKKPR